MTDSATATVEEEKPTDVATDAQAQEKKRSQEEASEKEAAQRRSRAEEALREAHAKSEEEKQKRQQQETADETARRMKRIEVQREKTDNYMRKKLSQYQPIQKKDRIEIKFEGADGAEHTVFEKQIKKGEDATPFYGYYGKQVDKEASLASVLKAVDAGLESVDVHGTEEQKEYLARLAHEHGLRVENYDMSKLGIDQDNLQDKKHEAGVTGKPASKFENEAKPDADAKSEPGPGKPDPKTPSGGGELVVANGETGPDAAAKQQMEDFNAKLLEGVKSGEIAVARNKNGEVYFSSRYAGASPADDPNIIDVEVIEVKTVENGQKQLPGSGPKLLEGASTSFAPQLLEGKEPKQLGDGRITDPARLLSAPQEDTPAVEQTSEAKKGGAAKQKKGRPQIKGTNFSGHRHDRHNTAHQTPAGKNGHDAFKGNRHRNFDRRNNSTHRPGGH